MSLNDLRLSANLPGDNFKSAVAGDGKIERFYKGHFSEEDTRSRRMTTNFIAQLFLSLLGFMLNLCSVALQLCDSFMLSKGSEKYKQIEAEYCSSKACRLRFDNERTLAGGHIGKYANPRKP